MENKEQILMKVVAHGYNLFGLEIILISRL